MGLIAAVVILAIVIIISVLVANFIWDAAHDVSAGNVDIELISCKKTGMAVLKQLLKSQTRITFVFL